MHDMRKKICAATVVLVATAAAASAQNRPFAVPPARVAQGNGAALSLPSTASPRAIVAQYLRGRGHDQATVDSLVEARSNATRQGLVHVQFEQRAGGLPVYGVYVKAAISARGELVNVIDNVVAVSGAVRPAQVNAQRAIDAAVANLYPALRTVPPGFFRSAPSASRVAIPQEDGSMSAGFLVETWTDASNELHYTLVDGDGAVLNVESRTNTTGDQYNVFRVNPNVTAQAIAEGPAPGGDESPEGWLFAGPQGATSIAGNNVHAYLDVDNNNASDGNGTTVLDGHFDTTADLLSAPATQQNRQVAVQNLFYLNNLIHDELYRHGFDEAALNFQEDNFGLGGAGSDSVNSEAQDGGGLDNANFSTPVDGSNPRMQMYLWAGNNATHTVLAGAQAFAARLAVFSPETDVTGVTGVIRLVDDGTGTTSDGCQSFSGVAGGIALIDRGNCDFIVKVRNAQMAGAVAVIVANNTGTTDIVVMGGNGRSRIPAVSVSANSGALLKAMVPVSGTVKLSDVQPLLRDGDIDADIVFHEYCHGLTWRMIGSMSGPMSGAIGEGMSDICAMMMTALRDGSGNLLAGADRIGEYSMGSANGIRRQPYGGYNLITYGDLSAASVHNDGEVYAAIGWRMYELFGHDRKDELFGYMVDGMNFTPPGPSFEHMRDGILQSIANTEGAPADDECKVWRAFAQYGVGVGATSVVRRTRMTITESFDVPASCQP